MSDQPPRPDRQRGNLVALVIVAVLILGSVGLLVVLHQGIRQESCFAANHRSCAPVDEDK